VAIGSRGAMSPTCARKVPFSPRIGEREMRIACKIFECQACITGEPDSCISPLLLYLSGESARLTAVRRQALFFSPAPPCLP